MTLQSVLGGWGIPFPWSYQCDRSGTPGFMSTAAAALPGGFVFLAPKAGTITKVSVAYVSTNPSGSLDYRLETVDQTTGIPTNTLFGTNTNIVVSGHSSADKDTMKTVTLTAGAVVTKGQELALMIRLSTGGSGTLACCNNVQGGGSGFPYTVTVAATKANMPIVALEYNDGTVIAPMGCLAMATMGQTLITNGNEYGIRFTLPFPSRVRGMGFVGDASGNGDYTCKLYDTDGTTVLTSANRDKDVDAPGVSDGTDTHYVEFPASPTITANGVYIATVLANDVSGVIFNWLDASSAAYMAAMPGGAGCYMANRAGGAWTYTTTRRPTMWAVLDAFDDAVSVGGESAHVVSG